MNPEELDQQWQQQNQKASKAIARWRKEHPKATFAEIEAAVDKELDQVRARMIEDVAQAQPSADVEQTARTCPQCGERMHVRGKHQRTFQTRGGQDVTLTRDFQSCPSCGYSFSPPR